MTILLGLDLSTTNIGFAIVERDKLATPLYTGETKLSGKNWNDRLESLERKLSGYVLGIPGPHPDIAGIEWPLLGSHYNGDSLIKQGIFLGAAVNVLTAEGILCRHFPNPTSVKVALAGEYRATKEDMQGVANLVVGREVGEHEADALGVVYALAAMLNEEDWNETGKDN